MYVSLASGCVFPIAFVRLDKTKRSPFLRRRFLIVIHSLQCATHGRYTGDARRDERDDGIDGDGDESRGGVSWDDRATGDRGCVGKERQDPEELFWVS